MFKKRFRKFAQNNHIEMRLVEDPNMINVGGMSRPPKFIWTPDEINDTVEKTTKTIVGGVVTVVVAKQVAMAVGTFTRDFSWSYFSRKVWK